MTEELVTIFQKFCIIARSLNPSCDHSSRTQGSAFNTFRGREMAIIAFTDLVHIVCRVANPGSILKELMVSFCVIQVSTILL